MIEHILLEHALFNYGYSYISALENISEMSMALYNLVYLSVSIIYVFAVQIYKSTRPLISLINKLNNKVAIYQVPDLEIGKIVKTVVL